MVEKQMPKISIVMPIYNMEKYLHETIPCLLNQTFKDFELICIDDGSTDKSLKILTDYSQKDKRIQVYTQSNQGAATARNYGINKANGEYLLILDSDDVYHQEMLEKLYNKAIDTNADITICHSVEFNNLTGENLTSDWIINDGMLPNKKTFNHKDIPKNIIGFTQGWSWDKLYKTEFVKQNNLRFQNLKATNDMYFVMLSLVLANKITVIQDVLIRHRQNNINSISNSRDKNPYCFIEAIYKLKTSLEERNLYEPIKQSFINWIVEFCFWHLDTLKLKKNKINLAKKLKNVVFEDLGVYQLDKSYFYHEQTYNRVHCKKLYQHERWYQKIFSIRNQVHHNTKHKVLKVLGIKFKFRRNNYAKS
ncbi:glycosyltransferase family 2 protein [bacterium]|nr:glycosyltransferase family 2 protein [bacterium]